LPGKKKKKDNMLDWRFLILMLLVIVILVLVVVTLYRYASQGCSSAKKQDSSEYYDSSMTMLPTLDVLYATYLNQIWPLTSNIHLLPGTMNINFSEVNTVRYFAFFDPSTTVVITGDIPQPCVYWSMVVYDNHGAVKRTFTDVSFSSGSYNIVLSNNGTANSTIPVPTDGGNYSVVMTVIQNSSTPAIYPAFVPNVNISRSTSSTETPTVAAINVFPPQQAVNSNTVQKTYSTILKNNDRSRDAVFPGINISGFFMPMRSTILPLLPDPNMFYLMAFADTARVIKITGTLPGSIGSNTPFRDASVIAGDFLDTSTSASCTLTAADAFFTVFAAFTVADAALYGYDPDPSRKQKLLIWDPSTIKPVVLLRYTYFTPTSLSPVIVQTATGVNSMSPSAVGAALGMLTSLDSTSNTIGSETVQRAMGSLYPIATCFQVGGSLPPSLPPPSSTGLGLSAGSGTSENYYYPSVEKHPSGMPYMNMTTKMLPSKSMLNQPW
jgi:hypothetical protein